ncbi:PREDICTED: cyclic AMP-dependent transcription factor ATF-7-like [Amphimedon queenslandica]|uniref:BZIP domain-containing protein n=1 Tax=Amphimedon queenslandica TaxID=400682 RepID=A0A1X7VBX2_AMPQE|nr:PREDICTED: cyclic AMP-dependent transcription factor ATF-7-like [Amphimedon queenslandica]|eukprot:XP_011402548.1 PREDICTED: cyclic AMP-dependent transcription factor ATF-7-like [Amphimedon queenslandica]
MLKDPCPSNTLCIETILKEAPQPPYVTPTRDLQVNCVSQHSLTQPCHAFNIPPTNNEDPSMDGTLDLFGADDDNPLFQLDDSLLEYCLKQDIPSIGGEGESCSPPERAPEVDPLDNPMLDSVFDLSAFLDPSLSSSSFLTPDYTQSLLHTQVSSDDAVPYTFNATTCTTAAPQSPLSSSSSPFVSSASSTTFPVSPSPISSSVCSPAPSLLDDMIATDGRKRKASSDVDPLPISPSKLAKKAERKEKNNAASKVSRAKRKQKMKSLFEREKELESENARLKLQVEEMTKEAEKLKKQLILRLSQ